MNNMKPVIEEGIYQVLDLSSRQINDVIHYFESLEISAEYDPTFGEIYFYQERLGDVGEILGDINSVQVKILDNDPDDSIKVSKAELSVQERLFDSVNQEVYVIYSEGEFVAPPALQQSEDDTSEKDLLIEALSDFIDYIENDFLANLDEDKECTCDESHITEPSEDDDDDTLTFSDFEKSFFDTETDDEEDEGDGEWEILLGNPQDAFSFLNNIAGASKVEITITSPNDEPLADDVLALLNSLGFSFD